MQLDPFRTYCSPYQLLFVPIVVHTSSFLYLLWSIQAMNLITVYFYCFSTHGTLPQRVNEVRPCVHMQLRIDSFSFLVISLYAFSLMQQTENKAFTGVCGVSCRLSGETDVMQFSHCYCFASERKVASAMLTIVLSGVLTIYYWQLSFLEEGT